MKLGTKLFLTVLMVALLFIPVIGELLAVPALAMLGIIWGVTKTQ